MVIPRPPDRIRKRNPANVVRTHSEADRRTGAGPDPRDASNFDKNVYPKDYPKRQHAQEIGCNCKAIS